MLSASGQVSGQAVADRLADPDVRQRLDYASFCLPELKLVYVETPKAACTSLKHVMMVLAGQDPRTAWRSARAEPVRHLTVHDRRQHAVPALTQLPPRLQHEALSSPRWLRFCVVRNPYVRLASAWTDRFLLHGLSPRAPIRRHLPLPRYEPDWTYLRQRFSEFVRHLHARERPHFTNHHWQPLVRLLLPDVISYTHIVRLENFAADMQPIIAHVEKAGHVWPGVPRLHDSPLQLGMALYTPLTARLVQEMYAEDFARFSYSTRWQTGAEELPSLPPATWVQAIQQRNRRIYDMVFGVDIEP